jgi:hypothetical protein|eukprot:COSAG01_NODE_2649_length_7312_cov_218.427977_6_plen_81_part_00
MHQLMRGGAGRPCVLIRSLSNDLLFYPRRRLNVRTGLDAERSIERVRALPVPPPGEACRLLLRTTHTAMRHKGSGVLSEV